jgi:hypothetical protein
VAAAFAQAGAAATDRAPDLVVVPAREVRAGLATEAGAMIAIGPRGQRAVRRQMPVVRRYLAIPDPSAPHLLIPLDRPAVARYALRTWIVSDSIGRRVRQRAADAAIAAGVFPDLERTLRVGLPADAPPFIVAAAAEYGVPGDGDWFLSLGLGDDLTRAVYHVFPRGASEPRWIIKFSRVPGYLEPFERDERGLALAAQLPAAAEHAPRLAGRLSVNGLFGSVESAAPGERLTYRLQRPGGRAQKVQAIDRVAGWLIDVSRQSAAPPERLAAELRRLREEVLPAWGEAIEGGVLDRLGAVPGVLQHNDVGCWNLIVGAHGFTAVDWESARAIGLPLWDLAYFLVDALVHLDGAWAADQREQHAARLLLGELPSSALLFSWLERAAQALAIPLSSVGPILTLGWLHHGLSPVSRAATAQVLAAGAGTDATFGEWMVRVWLDTPGLGVGWPAFTGPRRTAARPG